jgi:hypothetical protein
MPKTADDIDDPLYDALLKKIHDLVDETRALEK